MPATLISAYIGIASAFTPASAAFTELSGNGYARAPVTLTYDPPSGIIYFNPAEFGPATGTWTAGVEIGVFDALTNGNLLFAIPASTPAQVSGASFAMLPFQIQLQPLTQPFVPGSLLSTASPLPALTNVGVVVGSISTNIVQNGAIVQTGAARLAYSAAGLLSAYSGVTTLTDAATVTANAAASSYFTWTIGATGRTFVPTNGANGQQIYVEVVQDGTGSRTITTYTGVTWAGGTLPTLSTPANSVDVLRFTYNSASGKWRGETVGKAFA